MKSLIQKYDYETYFFNDIYDDELIKDKTRTWQTHLYHDILKGKAWYQNNRIINGDITDFMIRPHINRRFGFPANTYSLYLNTNIIPFYSERAFYDKYGFETVITSMDIIKDNKLFSKNLYFFLNGYYIHNVELITWKDKSILFIQESSDIKISDIENIINEDEGDNSWTLMLSSKSDYYLTTMTRMSLFSDNKIYLSNFTEKRIYNKPNKNNAWTLYITGMNDSYNIMTGTSATIQEDENGKYFLVNDKFKNYIYNNVWNVRCFVINEPDCDGCGIYVNTEESTPIFAIPYKKNPIPSQNLIIWEYDNETHRKLHPLVTFVDLKYPNIYNFENMLDASFLVMLFTNSKELVFDSNESVIIFDSSGEGDIHYDLFIEWVEPVTDISAFDSYIQDYMDCYQEDFTRQSINDELPELIQQYNPIEDLKIRSQDFYTSEYYDDYRAWKLSRIIELLKDNPKRYDELFHVLYYKAKKYLTRCYTPVEEPHIYQRSIMDNKDHCDNYDESVMLFHDPQSYIRVYNYTDEKKPVSLYIDGVFDLPKYVMQYDTQLFIYFPVSKLVNRPIQIDIDLIDEDIEFGSFSFLNSASSFALSELGINHRVALSDLIFYYDDGNYVDSSGLSITAEVNVYQIQYNGSDEVTTLVDLASETILADSEGDVIEPTDYDYIVLDVSTDHITVSGFNGKKKINLDDVSLMINKDCDDKSLYIRKSIHLATTDFYDQRVYTLTQEDNNQYVYHNFKGKPSKSRFRVFCDGRRISPNQYQVTFEGYDLDVTFDFLFDITGKLIIQYIGFDEELISEDTIREYKKSNSDIIYLASELNTPFDTLTHKVYINGYRIPDSRIKVVGQSNMLLIDNTDTEHTFTDNSVLSIYGQSHDKDVFGYDQDSQFLDKLSIKNDTFRNYLITKYS